MSAILRNLRLILQHPLNRTNRIGALARYVRWQLASRVAPGPIAVPFVDGTRLLVSRGMTGATGNVYCGLHEFEDMAFVLHALRPGDLFVDIGANVGSYTILAAGAAGADCIAFEPIPATCSRLLDNVRINDLSSRVDARNVGLGATPATLRFTSELDSENHVAASGEGNVACTEVAVERLDDALGGSAATVIKIDVEGYETEVLDGATATIESPSVLAVVMELNGSGGRYGHDDATIDRRMRAWGFVPCRYHPGTRSLEPVAGALSTTGNVLYVRDADRLRERLRSAPRHSVLGQQV